MRAVGDHVRDGHRAEVALERTGPDRPGPQPCHVPCPLSGHHRLLAYAATEITEAQLDRPHPCPADRPVQDLTAQREILA
ncbi:hypothetical protein GCM10022224_016670 [Nonomuraea antimicrobica]|uniref:Uncharacterized protein n=1 Tax=Nonomuraea antimicrobica TaxID=561173 RepID=A0ABP7BBU5_9ACTN